MGVRYVLSKSLPLRFALMKVGPSAGTRYSVERSARIENPKEAYNAGNAGTGLRNGLAINHVATGTRPNSKMGDKGRG
jgi:hypothetical protein